MAERKLRRKELLKIIREKEENLKIQMDNNKVLNKRNQNLQNEVLKYQKIIQELGEKEQKEE